MKINHLLALFVIVFNVHSVTAKTITVNKVEGEKEQLAFNILQLALSKSSPELSIKQSEQNYNETRLAEEIQANHIDVMWAGASAERDEKLLAIRIPIFKGLMGHRIFIIRSADQGKFSQIKNLTQLKKFKAGQATFWGDTQVLKSAGLPLVTTIKYSNLFRMLEGGRYDYFPRGVLEPWEEVEQHAHLNLTVEKEVMLIYPFALYFYVNQENQQLYHQIYSGFMSAIDDGSFDQLFFNSQIIKEAFAKANLSQRTILRIDNPYMHPDTPYANKKLWLDINQL
ncbi:MULTISPECIES: diguanylate cyclase [unclassified Vibrio]|uniref:diguanylate cyclase n=1 Tax=unclassified Vibrio TaxID=2614977 RepID=UPI001929AB49|nr:MULTISPECIES: diguanylate cyclase [unclassified Vibrio]